MNDKQSAQWVLVDIANEESKSTSGKYVSDVIGHFSMSTARQ